ncbi:MAG: BrnT family toxin [Rhodanobacter sp.]|nr:MAG: BrnT family toxin [Rhodanobacter sp.]TAL99508.1 MAG: BrnT family toxin [Rhodanobacter sp.]TAM38721.1 MAG: BrnT family toxin [Rhodanobacter sp.]TAN23194.1 MAG: BrnT family toxin [Rhodanobacter sp.]
MEISYDPAKNAANIAAGRPSFGEVARFDFQTAVFTVDDRRDYGETRYRGFGFLDQRLHALVFVETARGIRVVSFRKANDREVKRYEKARNA